MKSFFIVLTFIFAGLADADEAQKSLAREIETVSATSPQNYIDNVKHPELYTPINRHEMQIDGCDITARSYKVASKDNKEKLLSQITFDLSRSLLPNEAAPIGDKILHSGSSDDFSDASIWIEFLPHYQPSLRYLDSAGNERVGAASLHVYRMVFVQQAQLRRLLALLNQYQKEFCTQTG